MKLHKTFKIYIRSKDVPKIDSEFNSSMTVNLKAGLNLHSDEKFRLRLDSCEVPHTFYNVSKYVSNDQIYLDGNFVQLIPSGNYSIFDLCDYLTDISTFPYSAVYDDITSKITLTNTDSTTHIINFTQGFAKLTGFKAEDRQINGGSSLISFNTVNMQSIHSLFVHTSLASTNVISTETNSFQNIVGKIPVNKLPYEILSYDPTYSTFDVELDERSISTFNISLKDQNSNFIQMNGVNFELSLLLEVYKEEVEPVPTRRVEVTQPIITPITQPIPQPITQPIPQQGVTDTVIPESVTVPPTIPEPFITADPIPRPPIQKSAPIDIPKPMDASFSNHDLEDAILAAEILQIEGLL